MDAVQVPPLSRFLAHQLAGYGTLHLAAELKHRVLLLAYDSTMIVTVRSATDDLDVLLSVKPPLEAFAKLHEQLVDDDSFFAVVGHVHGEAADDCATDVWLLRKDGDGTVSAVAHVDSLGYMVEDYVSMPCATGYMHEFDMCDIDCVPFSTTPLERVGEFGVDAWKHEANIRMSRALSYFGPGMENKYERQGYAAVSMSVNIKKQTSFAASGATEDFIISCDRFDKMESLRSRLRLIKNEKCEYNVWYVPKAAMWYANDRPALEFFFALGVIPALYPMSNELRDHVRNTAVYLMLMAWRLLHTHQPSSSTSRFDAFVFADDAMRKRLDSAMDLAFAEAVKRCDECTDRPLMAITILRTEASRMAESFENKSCDCGMLSACGFMAYCQTAARRLLTPDADMNVFSAVSTAALYSGDECINVVLPNHTFEPGKCDCFVCGNKRSPIHACSGKLFQCNRCFTNVCDGCIDLSTPQPHVCVNCSRPSSQWATDVAIMKNELGRVEAQDGVRMKMVRAVMRDRARTTAETLLLRSELVDVDASLAAASASMTALSERCGSLKSRRDKTHARLRASYDQIAKEYRAFRTSNEAHLNGARAAVHILRARNMALAARTVDAGKLAAMQKKLVAHESEHSAMQKKLAETEASSARTANELICAAQTAASHAAQNTIRMGVHVQTLVATIQDVEGAVHAVVDTGTDPDPTCDEQKEMSGPSMEILEDAVAALRMDTVRTLREVEQRELAWKSRYEEKCGRVAQLESQVESQRLFFERQLSMMAQQMQCQMQQVTWHPVAPQQCYSGHY